MASIEGITSLEGVGGFTLISRSGQHWEMEEHPHSFVKICFTELAIRKKNFSERAGRLWHSYPAVVGSPSLVVSKKHRDGALISRHGGVGILEVISSLNNSMERSPFLLQGGACLCVGQLQSPERAE